MKANVLLESLKAAAAAIPGESGSPEARTLLLNVMAATQDPTRAQFFKVFKGSCSVLQTEHSIGGRTGSSHPLQTSLPTERMRRRR